MLKLETTKLVHTQSVAESLYYKEKAVMLGAVVHNSEIEKSFQQMIFNLPETTV